MPFRQPSFTTQESDWERRLADIQFGDKATSPDRVASPQLSTAAMSGLTSVAPSSAGQQTPTGPLSKNIIGSGGTGPAGARANAIKGRFFSNLPETEIGALTADPKLAASYYAAHYAPGGGNRAAIERSLNNFADPEALMRAMGYGGSTFTQNQQQLSSQQDVWDAAMGRGSGSPYRFNPSALVGNVLTAAKSLGDSGGMNTIPGAQANPLASHLWALAGGDARGLPQATNQMLAAALFNVVPQNTYQAVLTMLDRLAQDYEMAYAREPLGRQPNYVDTVLKAIGPSLGVGF